MAPPTISIHALLAESDVPRHGTGACHRDFYPRSPCGERHWYHISKNAAMGFLSTLSLRRATATSMPPTFILSAFLSTLSLRRATIRAYQRHFPTDISIHALLAESDDSQGTLYQFSRYISIHALLAESDAHALSVTGSESQFLSTLSLRRATYGWSWYDDFTEFLSTLSLRRATRRPDNHQQRHHISIHALLAESDWRFPPDTGSQEVFLSTLSLRRATPTTRQPPTTAPYFYPRSPCGERQANKICKFPIEFNFYPRSPCGERRVTTSFQGGFADFYPRSPCGERRFTISAHCFDGRISIHALLAESDGGPSLGRFKQRHFYPRSPCGERPEIVSRSLMSCQFLSTLSLRRATVCFAGAAPAPYISIHALLAESDIRSPQARARNRDFYPRSPCGERRTLAAP